MGPRVYPISTFSVRPAKPRPESGATAGHQRLRHAGPDALEYLSTAVTGARLKGLTTVECKDCSLSKAHQQVSRRPTPRTKTPFEKVHFDLIQMTEAIQRSFLQQKRLLCCEHLRSMLRPPP